MRKNIPVDVGSPLCDGIMLSGAGLNQVVMVCGKIFLTSMFYAMILCPLYSMRPLGGHILSLVNLNIQP